MASQLCAEAETVTSKKLSSDLVHCPHCRFWVGRPTKDAAEEKHCPDCLRALPRQNPWWHQPARLLRLHWAVPLCYAAIGATPHLGLPDVGYRLLLSSFTIMSCLRVARELKSRTLTSIIWMAFCGSVMVWLFAAPPPGTRLALLAALGITGLALQQHRILWQRRQEENYKNSRMHYFVQVELRLTQVRKELNGFSTLLAEEKILQRKRGKGRHEASQDRTELLNLAMEKCFDYGSILEAQEHARSVELWLNQLESHIDMPLQEITGDKTDMESFNCMLEEVIHSGNNLILPEDSALRHDETVRSAQSALLAGLGTAERLEDLWRNVHVTKFVGDRALPEDSTLKPKTEEAWAPFYFSIRARQLEDADRDRLEEELAQLRGKLRLGREDKI